MVRVSVRAAEPAAEELALFRSELDRLVRELWTWSPSRWSGERVATMRELAVALVGLAERAGAPPPAGVALPVVAPYALADQLAVLGRDVIEAPQAERAATEALAHLTAARAALG